jgi:hypothetical protein
MATINELLDSVIAMAVKARESDDYWKRLDYLEDATVDLERATALAEQDIESLAEQDIEQ